jgi:gas vesicle protein
MAATMLGASLGAVAGYLFFSDSGKALRRKLEPLLKEFARDASGFGQAIAESSSAASGGWKLLLDLIGDQEVRTRSSQPEQTRPF